VLPTFVIGLREGLEASLIVGIVAAFLRRNASDSGLRRMWLGVLAAVTVCVVVGVALDALASELPQRHQEGLETVIAAAAVGMVTYMIVWMKKHSRDLKGSLESAAGSALAQRSAMALVLMAFLAVLREGLETVVFLLAAFNASGAAGAAASGAALGIVVAVALGYAIYRGGVRLNLSRFFRATGVVLALVAGGLVVSALHTGHEAGWINIGQDGTFSLHWLAAPGSIRASLLTGVLGVQPDPTFIEVIGWLAYVMPVVTIVCWPPGVPVPRRSLSRGLLGGAAFALVAAAGLAVAAPAEPARATAQTLSLDVRRTASPSPAALALHAAGRDSSASGRESVTVRSLTSSRLVVRWSSGGSSVLLELRPRPDEQLEGISTRVYAAGTTGRDALTGPAAGGRSWARSLTAGQLATAMNGRLPLGIGASATRTPMRVMYTSSGSYRVYLDPATMHVIDARRDSRTVATLKSPSGGAVSLGTVARTASAATAESVQAAVEAIQHKAEVADRHEWMRVRWPVTLCLLALASAGVAWWLRSEPDPTGRTSLRRIREGAAR
jgi:high-affinity iron transporter